MHTYIQYRGLNESHEIIVWFWKLVHSLKEEEKALLLKFATGSPRVPASGFASLQVIHQSAAQLGILVHAIFHYFVDWINYRDWVDLPSSQCHLLQDLTR